MNESADTNDKGIPGYDAIGRRPAGEGYGIQAVGMPVAVNEDAAGGIIPVMEDTDDSYAWNNPDEEPTDIIPEISGAGENIAADTPDGDKAGSIYDVEKKRAKGYGDIIAEMRKDSGDWAEQEKKESKRRRAMLVLGALNDGIAGMANIFAARKGALPVWHYPVTGVLDARYREMLDERRRRSAYLDNAGIRARMSDLNRKLTEERQRRRSEMVADAAVKGYGSDGEPYGLTRADRPEHAVRDEQAGEYPGNDGNRKKSTGINW